MRRSGIVFPSHSLEAFGLKMSALLWVISKVNRTVLNKIADYISLCSESFFATAQDKRMPAS